jgi:hypothetical protein
MRTTFIAAISSAAMAFALTGHAAEPGKPMRAGIIGLDTGHVVAFTTMLHDPKATGELAEMRIVAAYPGGSRDIPDS